MHIASLVIAIIAGIGVLIGFIPCFGWLNWINIPLALIGIVLSAIALSTLEKTENAEKSRMFSVIAIIISSCAFILGAFRLILGGGII